MLFDEDPLDYVCRQIVDFLTRLAFAIRLLLVALCMLAWCDILLAHLTVRGWIRTAGNHLRQIGSNTYWRHIHVWLVVNGFQRESTWVEIEEHRLRAIARTGVNIPRPPALEEGLRQELGLDA